MEAKPAEPVSPDTMVRERGLRVVAIGGGTGLSTLLKGLKRFVLYPAEIPTILPDSPVIRDLCAVVTVSDDGGSSGRLRKELNMLPPGDIRNCIVALSEDEALLSKLFRHRFDKGSGLEGHSFGNLFLAALTSITSDFSEAVRLSSEILLTRGHIHPATTSNIELEALMEDGTRVRGETKITASKGRIHELFLVPPDVEPIPQTLEAIAHADLITIGPGSLFTSLIPNLLVRGISQAIVSSPAIKIFICNLMTQANESLNLTASDHILALNRHAQRELFDYALINRMPVSDEMKAKYMREGGSQIVNDLDAIEALGVIPVLGDYLEEDGVARDNTSRVAQETGGVQKARLSPKRTGKGEFMVRTRKKPAGRDERHSAAWGKRFGVLIVVLLAASWSTAQSSKLSRDLQALPSDATVSVVVQYYNPPTATDLYAAKGAGAGNGKGLGLVKAYRWTLSRGQLSSLISNDSNVKYISLDRSLQGAMNNAVPAVR